MKKIIYGVLAFVTLGVITYFLVRKSDKYKEFEAKVGATPLGAKLGAIIKDGKLRVEDAVTDTAKLVQTLADKAANHNTEEVK